MRVNRILAAIAGGAIAAAAGVAVASNLLSSAHSDFYAPGEHQFYVWCAGSSDHMATEPGRNAEDAQMKLYAAEKLLGHATCWPVWQGRVGG